MEAVAAARLCWQLEHLSPVLRSPREKQKQFELVQHGEKVCNLKSNHEMGNPPCAQPKSQSQDALMGCVETSWINCLKAGASSGAPWSRNS